MHSRTLRTLTATAAATATAIAAGLALVASSPALAAGAPTLSVTAAKACYVNTYSYDRATSTYTEHDAAVNIQGTGWTPGDEIQIGFAGNDEPNVTVDAAGAFSESVKLTDPPFGYESTNPAPSAAITATDIGNAAGGGSIGATAATKPINYTTRQVTYFEPGGTAYFGENSDLGYTDRADVRASGFAPGKPIYAHYVLNGASYTNKGKLLTTVDLGRASGPCGVLRKRNVRMFPFRESDAQQGDATIWYSALKSWSERNSTYAWYFDLSD